MFVIKTNIKVKCLSEIIMLQTIYIKNERRLILKMLRLKIVTDSASGFRRLQ